MILKSDDHNDNDKYNDLPGSRPSLEAFFFLSPWNSEVNKEVIFIVILQLVTMIHGNFRNESVVFLLFQSFYRSINRLVLVIWTLISHTCMAKNETGFPGGILPAICSAVMALAPAGICPINTKYIRVCLKILVAREIENK